VRLPTKEDPHYYLRRSKFTLKSDADAELSKVISLVAQGGNSEQRRRQIGSAIRDTTARGRPLDEKRIRHQVGEDRDPSLPVPTVGEWARDYVAQRGQLRPGTRAVYARYTTHYLIPWLGDTTLDVLRPVHVKKMLDGIRRRTESVPNDGDPPDLRGRRSKAGPALRSKVLDFLRVLMKAAVDENVISRNPIARFEPEERYDPPERGAWSPAQVDIFLRHAEGHRLYALFRVALLYGLRRGELLGLRWSDLDLDGGTLAVRQQLGWWGGEPRVNEPKTRKSQRSFSIGEETVAALRRHRQAQVVRDLRWDLVFCREDGSPLRHYEPLFELKRLADEVGLRRLNLHELRHTAITNMLMAGINPKIVSERAGHATVNITLDTYGHVLHEHDQAAAATIEGTIG
jgi:integrase